jgi:hypothetical protein
MLSEGHNASKTNWWRLGEFFMWCSGKLKELAIKAESAAKWTTQKHISALQKKYNRHTARKTK